MKLLASSVPRSLTCGLLLATGAISWSGSEFCPTLFHATLEAQDNATKQATPPKNLGSLEVLDPAFEQLVDPTEKIEVLGSGFDWSEGPVWQPESQRLLFSDIPRNQILQWQDGKPVSVYQERVGYTGDPQEGGREPGTNGLFLSPTGQLYACCHGDRCIKRQNEDGQWEVVVDRYDGKRFNSPNDLVFHSNGDLYFTDPPYGTPAGQKRELDYCGVYRWDGQEVTLMTKELKRPNGIGFSPDFQTLYVAQSDGEAPIWMAYPLKEDGSLKPGHVLADAKDFYGKVPGSPDGMTVDQSGNLWVTAPGGVWALSPKGKVLGKVLTGQATANCTFGGPDGSWLLITADMYLCRLKTKTHGMK